MGWEQRSQPVGPGAGLGSRAKPGIPSSNRDLRLPFVMLGVTGVHLKEGPNF
jgi:hypothetical protein